MAAPGRGASGLANVKHARDAEPDRAGGPIHGGRLGLAADRTHNPGMTIQSDNPEHGFQFPGTFELSALGPAESGLERVLPQLLMDAGIDVQTEAVQWKHSSNGRFVSVRIGFRAASRAQYDLAHQVLRDHPEVKWTM